MPIDTITYAGTDYPIQDTTARTSASNAMSKANEVDSNEIYNRQAPPSFFWDTPERNSNNTYSRARSVGSPFFWNSLNMSTTNASWYPGGMLMRTTKAVTAGTLINPGVNCKPYAISNFFDNVKTYVGSDGKLHYTDPWGADSALNFSSFTPNNSLSLEADGAGKTIVINNVKNAVIIHFSFGTDYHGAMKVYWKWGSTLSLHSQNGDHSRLGYSGLTETSVTLTFNPWSYPFHACEVYPF